MILQLILFEIKTHYVFLNTYTIGSESKIMLRNDKLCTAIAHLCQLSMYDKPGREAQSVGHLARKSAVLGSIPGLAT